MALSLNLNRITFGTSMSMTLCLKKKLINNAIHKCIRERNDFDKEIKNIETTIISKLNTID